MNNSTFNFFFFCRLIQVWEKILVEKAHMIHTCDSLLLMPNPSFNTRWVHVEFTLACILQIRCLTTPLNDLWILIKYVVWRIWSLNKARKTITQLRCKTKQRLKWTPKETFLWDYVKLQTAPCLHNWHYWITADTWQSRQGLRHCQQVTLFMRRIWPVPTKKQK